MKLSVDSLRESGSFAGAPVKREVSWTVEGEVLTADVYVRRLSYASAVNDIQALANDGDLGAARIATCIVDEDGNAVFRIADVTGFEDDGKPVINDDGEERGGLISSLVTGLLVLIGEVNGLGKLDPEKDSTSQ